ncbi:holo-ACP synthase [Hellea balneolensis]|uniref:holo-ACP synthase n=1 Tax=Hellea balneolensis TaxID=287478 RepID=UPI0003FAC0E3|nr:holo-ACP synthase [Hellea balneolensis]
MILGIGTDICDISRIEKSIDKFGQRFIDKTFTQNEQDYCESKSGKASYYAKRFAAKEAVAKALATSSSGALSWLDVEVKNDPSGRPQALLYRGAQDRLEAKTPNGYKAYVHLSLSDDHPYAVAYAMIEARSD